MRKTKELSIPDKVRTLIGTVMSSLEKGEKPTLKAIRCSLDNCIYDPKLGFFTPGDKLVSTELNAGSVKKLTRVHFILDILLANIASGAVNTKREIYYIAKGAIKSNPELKAIDFASQDESDEIIDFVCELLEVYREELNCYANDRGGQTYSQQLIVTEHLTDGTSVNIELSQLGTSPFQPKNRPQNLTLSTKSKIDFCLIVESEGTANSLVANGFCKRNKAIVVGSQGVPSNAVRGWIKRIQDQLGVPLYFFGDLDAYTIQNIFRTLKAGSAASLIRNKDFSAPDVKFLGVLPGDIEKYGLADYVVNEKDEKEARAIKKAKDALANDPFFKDPKNSDLAKVLEWLHKNKRRCEQQSLYGVDPSDPIMTEKIILEKIKNKSFI